MADNGCRSHIAVISETISGKALVGTEGAFTIRFTFHCPNSLTVNWLVSVSENSFCLEKITGFSSPVIILKLSFFLYLPYAPA